MRPHNRGRGEVRPGRQLVLYVGLLAISVGVVVWTLVQGGRLDAAPQAPERSSVSRAAARCLGTQLTALQSGTYLDLHAPQVDGADGTLGPRVLRGRVDSDGTVTMRGRCAGGSALSGRAVSATLQLQAAGAAVSLDVAGREITGDLQPTEEAAQPPAPDHEPLEGGDLVARTFLAVAVVLVAARLVGLAFGRLRLTRVMGEIVAGVMLGPSLLGAVWPEASRYLFPSAVTNVLEVIGQFGLIFFMFLVGLELNRRLVKGLGRNVVILSHASIMLPFSIGMLLAVVLYPRVGGGQFSGFALFLGAAMSITAFPVLARILHDTRLNRTPLGALAITAAAVDDLTAWCILAVVVAVAGSGGADQVALTIALTVIFVGVMVGLARPLLRRAAIHLRDRGRLDAALVPSALIGLLLSAWATEMIGIHAIFGAFVFGVVVPRPPWLRADLQGRLEGVTLLFLLPIFFAVVGLSTRVGLLVSRELWLITAAVIAAAIAGKLGGSLLAARSCGHSWRESTALGVLMNTRGLTEIVILTVGQSLGVISPALFTILVLMALATTLMATPLLSVLYPPWRVEREMGAELGASLPTHQVHDVVAWLTGGPDDPSVYELASAAAAERGVTPVLVHSGGTVLLDEVLAASALVVVSAGALRADQRLTGPMPASDTRTATVLVVGSAAEAPADETSR